MHTHKLQLYYNNTIIWEKISETVLVKDRVTAKLIILKLTKNIIIIIIIIAASKTTDHICWRTVQWFPSCCPVWGRSRQLDLRSDETPLGELHPMLRSETLGRLKNTWQAEMSPVTKEMWHLMLECSNKNSKQLNIFPSFGTSAQMHLHTMFHSHKSSCCCITMHTKLTQSVSSADALGRSNWSTVIRNRNAVHVTVGRSVGVHSSSSADHHLCSACESTTIFKCTSTSLYSSSLYRHITGQDT